MNITTEVGSYRRIAAASTATLCSGPCALLGVRVAGIATTAPFVQIWDGSDATLASPGTIVMGTSTLAINTYHPMPATLLSGLTIQATAEVEVDLTFFYLPMGNNT